ncbi:MAG: 6-phosphogluconolactonase [Kiritimatiellia bacterium]|nr:6-phosphogluconolactonase [Kiritimatiellia bacterium]
MPDIGYRHFESVSALNTAVAALLKHHFEREYPALHAVMLSGGKTPFEAYRLVAGEKCIAAAGLRLFLSDERLVPIASAESNFGNMRFFVEALNLQEDQFIRINPELQLSLAAEQYDQALRKFINTGGIIPLGLLGLGADGHTASLFCEEDLERGKERYAIPVTAPNGLRRVSVTPHLLSKIQQVVFVVAGPEKKAIVDQLTGCPSSVVAGLAVAGVRRKQLWFAP